MSGLEDLVSPRPARPRVLKAPAIRRAELVDCAQALFLRKGYEKTTINDVIAATGLSKGAFYHHFKAKEDLLEAIALRFGEAALANLSRVYAEPSLNALQRLNLVLAIGTEWKIEHLPQLRAMFVTLLRPDNGVLYHRIVAAVFAAMAPALTGIIEQGHREGLFDPVDPEAAAATLLWLAEARRPVVVEALDRAEAGEVEAAVALIMRRVRVEEAIVDRLLGAPAGSVTLVASEDEMRRLLAAWRGAREG